MATISHRVSLEELENTAVRSWDDIHAALDRLTQNAEQATEKSEAAPAVAFITFEYGIDGVSMEIAKYAACLERHFAGLGQDVVVHCIAGDFAVSADNVLVPRWRRFVVPDTNGWSKWCGGRWFDKLFRADMPDGSDASAEMASEIWRQALQMARRLVDYAAEQHIALFVPVNVNSNPGNPAFALAVVLAAETAGVPVLNSNHDFFWESGKPATERGPGEPAGPRDHFFRNHANASFFSLLERIFPWNGRRWHQLVINEVQQETLITRYGFHPSHVGELGTYVEDSFFIPCTRDRREELRLRLGAILGEGAHVVPVEPVQSFVASLDNWMTHQRPVLCGVEPGLSVDTSSRTALWFLQPTRIVGRKRIQRDWELIGALLDYAPFRAMFEQHTDITLTLHVTGPVPIEHQEDLEAVLEAYLRVLESLPAFINRRIYQAFTAGTLGQSAFQKSGLENMTVSGLYHLSDLVLLPSSTEGRGLPILESAAAGVPLVCSRYHPKEVFAKVVGEDLDPVLRIKHGVFPEGHFDTLLLQEVTDLAFLPELDVDRRRHNRRAVAARFSMRDVTQTFATSLRKLGVTD